MPPGERDRPDPSVIVEGARHRRPRHQYGASPSPDPATSSTHSGKRPATENSLPNEEAQAQHPSKRTKTNTASSSNDSRPDSDSANDIQDPEPAERIDLTDPNAVDEDGLYKDVQKSVLPPKDIAEKRDATADIKHFFSDAAGKANKKGVISKRRCCSLCRANLSADVSTCRRHMAATHNVCEWNRLLTFTKLLSLFDDAQQEFSADGYPCLHLVLPALEKLYANLDQRLNVPEYAPFIPAIRASLDSLEKHYSRTELSDAYIICTVLDPTQKMTWFDREWDDDAREKAWSLFKSRFEAMYEKDGGPPPPTKTSKTSSKMKRLLSDSYVDTPQIPSVSPVPIVTWQAKFDEYMNGQDELAEDQSIVTWWGLNSQRLPVWASIARDYLPIMASSVSSERVFSAGGITINKLRNRLRGDVVEALQLLKYALRNDDQYFREQCSMITEEALEDAIALEEEVMEEVDVAKEWVLDIDCFLEDSAAVDSTFED